MKKKHRRAVQVKSFPWFRFNLISSRTTILCDQTQDSKVSSDSIKAGETSKVSRQIFVVIKLKLSDKRQIGTVRSLSEFAILCQYSFVVTNFSRAQDNVPDRAIFTDKEIETASMCIFGV